MYKSLFPALLLLLILQACQEEFIPDTSLDEQQYVVEGYIEVKEDPLPAYVMLTRSFPFFDTIGLSSLQEAYVSGADVRVFDGDNTVTLTQVCLSDLPEEIREDLISSFGFDANSLQNDICLYADVLYQLTYEEGRNYVLEINVEGHQIRSITSVPSVVPLTSFRWEQPADESNDTLLQLWCGIEDPPGENFYRYKTASLNRELIAPLFSVINDPFFDNQSFEFPLDRAHYLEEGIDLNTAGLYLRGDSITIQWISIDEENFHFWNTLEFNAANQGPFSSYTRIDSNVDGALGIWGGYGIVEYELVVPD